MGEIKEMGKNIDEKKIKAFLNDVMDEIGAYSDVTELNELRSLFRKNVPLSKRAYVAAFLIKQLQSGSSSFHSQRGDARQHSKYPRTPARPRIILAPEVSTSLFVGIGRRRRIFPKDLITLLMQTAEIERERIGEIRILDNYSFVQVMEEDAEMIIEKVNNTMFRGRPLAVSHSYKTEDEARRGDTHGGEASAERGALSEQYGEESADN